MIIFETIIKAIVKATIMKIFAKFIMIIAGSRYDKIISTCNHC